MRYIRKTVQSGSLLEVNIYPAYADGRRRPRAARRNTTRPAQQTLNDLYSRKELQRLICCNFSGRKGDLFATFTFAGRPTKEEAKRACSAFLRRVQRLRAKRGLEVLRYICVPECQGGRWHFHMIVNAGISAEELHRLWGHGRCSFSLLEDGDQHASLAAYLVKKEKPRKGQANGENSKTAREKHERRYTCSHNLRRPVITREDVRAVRFYDTPKAPAGYIMLDWCKESDAFGYFHLRYTCAKLEEWRRRPPTRAGCSRTAG